MIAVTAPLKKAYGNLSVPEKPDSLEKQWLDVEYRHVRKENEFRNTYFGGDSFPHFWINLGPGILATYMGAVPEFKENTVWFGNKKIINDWNNPPEGNFDTENKWWQYTLKMTKILAKKGKNKYRVSITDLGGAMDILASLRGNQELLQDLIDYSDQVKNYLRRIDAIWLRAFSELDNTIRKFYECTTCWMPLWCDKKWYPIQCDLSSMISPQMFKDFALPSLKLKCDFLDYTIYHLDGPGELPHLDYLLDIKNLDGIQWKPDPNVPLIHKRWIPLYKKIQDAGKNLVLLNVDSEKVEWLFNQISPKGVYLGVSFESQIKAENFIENIDFPGLLI